MLIGHRAIVCLEIGNNNKKLLINMRIVKIIEYVFNVVRRTVRKTVSFVEYLANYLEAFIWSVRNKIIFLALVILIIPFCAQITNIEGAGRVLVTFFVIDIILTLVTTFYKPKNRIIPLRERAFSIIPYVWVFIETTINYFDWSVYFLDEVMRTSFGQNNFYTPLINFIEQYTSLPGGQFIQVGLFFLFYYGVGRNKLVFPFFIRYNYIQAILFTGISTFVCHIFMLWAKAHTVPAETGVIAVLIYSLTALVYGFCIVSTIFGRESNIPFIHQAIMFHTGLRDDDGRNPIGTDEYDK
jgi:hypothetical protein